MPLEASDRPQGYLGEMRSYAQTFGFRRTLQNLRRPDARQLDWLKADIENRLSWEPYLAIKRDQQDRIEIAGLQNSGKDSADDLLVEIKLQEDGNDPQVLEIAARLRHPQRVGEEGWPTLKLAVTPAEGDKPPTIEVERAIITPGLLEAAGLESGQGEEAMTRTVVATAQAGLQLLSDYLRLPTEMSAELDARYQAEDEFRRQNPRVVDYLASGSNPAEVLEASEMFQTLMRVDV